MDKYENWKGICVEEYELDLESDLEMILTDKMEAQEIENFRKKEFWKIKVGINASYASLASVCLAGAYALSKMESFPGPVMIVGSLLSIPFAISWIQNDASNPYTKEIFYPALEEFKEKGTIRNY